MGVSGHHPTFPEQVYLIRPYAVVFPEQHKYDGQAVRKIER